MAIDAYALILGAIGLGAALARAGALPSNAALVLNQVVLFVCLPAMILRNAPRLDADPALIGVAVIPWALFAVNAALVGLAARFPGFGRDERTALVLCAGLCNSSFLGFPLVRALVGEDGVPIAMVYDQFGSFALLSTVGLGVLAAHGGGSLTARQVVVRLVGFPPAWALLVGLTVMPEDPPSWMAVPLDRVADALVPLVMLAVGLSLELRLPRNELRTLAFGLGVRLAALPAVAWALGWTMGLPDLILRTAVLESAMPPMATAAALCLAHGVAPRLCSAMVGYGVLLALGTVPLWAALVR